MRIFLGGDEQNLHLPGSRRGAAVGRWRVGHVVQALGVELDFGHVEGDVLIRFVLHGLLQFVIGNCHHRNLAMDHRAARNGADNALVLMFESLMAFEIAIGEAFWVFQFRLCPCR